MALQKTSRRRLGSSWTSGPHPIVVSEQGRGSCTNGPHPIVFCEHGWAVGPVGLTRSLSVNKVGAVGPVGLTRSLSVVKVGSVGPVGLTRSLSVNKVGAGLTGSWSTWPDVIVSVNKVRMQCVWWASPDCYYCTRFGGSGCLTCFFMLIVCCAWL